MIETSGIELCTEPFGEPTDPPVLLVMGLGASMLWWEEEFCRSLADGGRFVIRYDHRDTGRSTTYEPGRPGYSGADLVADAAGVLDAYGLGSAHVVGVSAGGAMAQLLALDFADRVLSLVLISTSPAVPVDRDLPPPTDDFSRFVAEAEVDWSDRESVIEYLVDYSRLLAGGQRPFDEAACRDFVRRDVERADNVASLQNHDVMAHDDRPHPPLSSITVPTLVIHGTADPMFPLAHGHALAEEIPGATLLPTRWSRPRRRPSRLADHRARDPPSHGHGLVGRRRPGKPIEAHHYSADPALPPGGRMRGIRQTFTWLMALVLAACGCTDEGCGNDLRFDGAMLSAWAGGGEFTLQVCVEGDCETLEVEDDMATGYFGMPHDPDISGSADVEVTAVTDAGRSTATGTIDLMSYRPNGGYCAPICQGADVAIEGDTVRNAEPGEVPPRD